MIENDIAAAENRVKEMELTARQYIEQTNRAMQSRGAQQNQQRTRFEPVRNTNQNMNMNMNTARPQFQAESPPPPLPEPSPARAAPERKPPLFIDGEKLLILLLIALLFREKADIRLIAALGYLII